MSTEPPPSPPGAASAEEVDLVVVGALTLDRFADGTVAPGGSVIHAARALAAIGRLVSVVTVAGPEPEAQAAVAELASLARVQLQSAAATLAFRHGQTPAGRELLIERAASPLAAAPERFAPRAVLYAPVADELTDSLAGQRHRGALVRGAILQGWLRAADSAGRVRSLPLAALPLPLVAELADLDLLVASREDLLATAPDPAEQLVQLRRHFGPRPSLVVTDAERGALLAPAGATPRAPVVVSPPFVVAADGRETVGAGDLFAAVLLAEIAGGAEVTTAAASAAVAVAGWLRGRSGSR
jgi:sugar/nucleoside kinase (ribokinase family)